MSSSLPTKAKTWQLSKNLVVSSGPSMLLKIHHALTGFATPWAVAGSSDSVIGAMDGVDRWTAVADVVSASNTGTIHSWMVYNHPTGAQFCIDYIGQIISGSFLSVVVSPGGLFSGGSEKYRPAAPDEAYMASRQFYDSQTRVNVWLSDDGLTMYAVTPHTPSSTGRATWVLGSMLPPYPTLESSLVAGVNNSRSAWMQDYCANATFLDVPNAPFIVVPPGSASAGSWAITDFDCSALTNLAESGYGYNDLKAAYLMSPVGIGRHNYSSTSPWNGPQGILPDFYAAAASSDGDHIPASGTKLWVKVASWVLPWDGGTAMEAPA